MGVSEPLSLEEFLLLPEKKPALEYEDGRVTQKPLPKGQHSRLQVVVAALINRLAEPRKLALAFTELRATFGGYSRVPDVSVYRWDRIPLTPEGRIANDFRDPPDIVVEIVSPGQRVNRAVRRCLWYVDHGVRAALLLDPADDSALLFRPERPVVALHGSDQIDLDEILPGFRIAVEDLFDTLTLR